MAFRLSPPIFYLILDVSGSPDIGHIQVPADVITGGKGFNRGQAGFTAYDHFPFFVEVFFPEILPAGRPGPGRIFPAAVRSGKFTKIPDS